MDPATSYAEKVLDGRLLAGPYVRATCQRHLTDLDHAHERGWVFKPELAQPVLDFFPSELAHFREPLTGEPFWLLPWEEFLIVSLYGWVHMDTGDRRFRRLYLETAKGSGKTPWSAGVLLHRTGFDGGEKQESFVIGRHAEQAQVGFDNVTALSARSKMLTGLYTIFGGNYQHTVFFHHNLSSIKRVTKSTEGKGKSGPTPTAILADEYHEHADDKQLSLYEAGFKKTYNPLTLIVTNSGTDESTACQAEHDYSIKVALGDFDDDRHLSFVCALDEQEKKEWDTNEACWAKANPSLQEADQPGMDYLRTQVAASRTMPSRKQQVARLNFCLWGSDAELWIDREKWLAAEVRPADARMPDDEDLSQALCYGAIDLSVRTDLCAYALAFDFRPWGRGLFVKVRALTPEATLKDRERMDKTPYSLWVDQGYLQTCPGDIVEPAVIAAWIQADLAAYQIAALAYDAWRVDQLELELEKIGVETTRRPQEAGLLLVAHEQGFRSGDSWHTRKKKFDRQQSHTPPPRLFMPRSIDAVEEFVLKGNLAVEYSPLVRNAGVMAKVETDPQGVNRAFTKKRSTARIDPLVALTMAAGCSIELPKFMSLMPKNPLLQLLRDTINA